MLTNRAKVNSVRLNPDGLAQIVANFADRTIGCVSSVDRVLGKDGRPGGEGAYVRYEMWLRNLESRVCSLVGLSGSFFAARKEVCQDFSGEMQSDFRTLLNSMKMGLRGVSDPDAVGYSLDVGDSEKEFERKVRTVLRGITVFFSHLEFLNVFEYGFFSYQFFCHKLLRWLLFKHSSTRSKNDSRILHALLRGNRRIYRAWLLKDEFEHLGTSRPSGPLKDSSNAGLQQHSELRVGQGWQEVN